MTGFVHKDCDKMAISAKGGSRRLELLDFLSGLGRRG